PAQPVSDQGWQVIAGDRTAPGRFDRPSSVAVDAAGNVYVADARNRRVQKLSADGMALGQWGSEVSGLDAYSFPTAVALDRAGNIYVAYDQGGVFDELELDVYQRTEAEKRSGGSQTRSRIQKLAANGTVLADWGQVGSRLGEYERQYGGLTVDGAGNVY